MKKSFRLTEAEKAKAISLYELDLSVSDIAHCLSRSQATIRRFILSRGYTPLIDKIYRQTVEREEGCLLWTGYLTKDGYPRIRVNGKDTTVHRLLYEYYHYRELEPGERVYRVCGNKLCLAAEHLEAR